jgi:4-nitrophenyl phosphatase
LQEETKGAAYSVYAIGEEGLITALSEAGYRFDEERPDAVVVGIDRDFHYDKMKKACLAIRNGARFIGTNGDKALPTEEGLLPGNGSLCAAIATATGVDPVFVGKPEPFMVHYALERLGSRPEETLVVGDNLLTDIRAGAVAGIDTLLVYTGVTTREQTAVSDIRPTYEVDNLMQWMQKEAASR